MVVAFYVITILIGEQYIAQARGVELFFSVSGVLCIVMGIVLLVIRARKIPKEEKERIKRAKKQKKAAKTRSKFEEQQRIEDFRMNIRSESLSAGARRLEVDAELTN